MVSFFSKIKQALSNTSSKISSGISNIVSRKKLDSELLEELEELLITSDIGATTASQIISEFGKNKFNADITSTEIQLELAQAIENILSNYQQDFLIDESKPTIIMVCGVNGNGKTTTIGKLSAYYSNMGKKVIVAACDTFRAAAIEQLEIWTQRANVEIIKNEENNDAAALAFKACQMAQAQKADILFIDTAGRLHNNHNLMAELQKISNAIEKSVGYKAQYSLLVLDATTGQNALSQLESFKQIANVNGLIVTKLDGTAKAGVVVSLMEKFKIPIYFIGVGESIDDIRPFNHSDFTKALVGIEQ